MEFMILPRHNTLLGLDWFNLIGAHIETYSNKLVFCKKEIFLDSNNLNFDEINLTEINIIDQVDDDSEEIIEPWDSDGNTNICICL